MQVQADLDKRIPLSRPAKRKNSSEQWEPCKPKQGTKTDISICGAGSYSSQVRGMGLEETDDGFCQLLTRARYRGIACSYNIYDHSFCKPTRGFACLYNMCDHSYREPTRGQPRAVGAAAGGDPRSPSPSAQGGRIVQLLKGALSISVLERVMLL